MSLWPSVLRHMLHPLLELSDTETFADMPMTSNSSFPIPITTNHAPDLYHHIITVILSLIWSPPPSAPREPDGKHGVKPKKKSSKAKKQFFPILSWIE